MGTVHKFEKRPRNWRKAARARGVATPFLLALGGAVILGGVIGFGWPQDGEAVPEGAFSCIKPRIIDGDTFDCAGTRVRLQGIDAPEAAGHCRHGRVCAPGDPIASTDNLRKLVGWRKVICRRTDEDVYGRTVARCSAAGVDLSCAQVRGGYAILRYVPIAC